MPIKNTITGTDVELILINWRYCLAICKNVIIRIQVCLSLESLGIITAGVKQTIHIQYRVFQKKTHKFNAP